MGNDTDPFEAARLRREQLLKSLSNLPLVEVFGVVGPNGVGGGKVGKEAFWIARFSFEAWHAAGGELHEDTLEINRRVTDDELRLLQAAIKPYAIMHIRARVSVGLPRESQALLEEILGPRGGDVDLQRIADQLLKPVTYRDEVFGVLMLDRRFNWYSVATQWNGDSVTLYVSTKKGASPAEGLRTAHELWKDERKWDQQIKDYATLRLLPLKHEAWTDEQDAPMSEVEFREKMKLESIKVHPDGSFEFWCNDGDLFWGHAIHISGDLKNGPTDADTPG